MSDKETKKATFTPEKRRPAKRPIYNPKTPLKEGPYKSQKEGPYKTQKEGPYKSQKEGPYKNQREGSEEKPGIRGLDKALPKTFGYNRSKGAGRAGKMVSRPKVEKFQSNGREEGIPKWVMNIKKLHRDKFREQENRFLAEGSNVVATILATAPDIFVKVFLSEDFNENELLLNLEDANVKMERIPQYLLKEIATTKTTPGIIAICQAAPLRPNWDRAQMVTLVDAVQDPGNLGAIFRTSIGFGMDAVVMGSGTVDPFNPKVVRGSSGTFLKLPFENRVDMAERILFLKSKGFTIIATSPHAVQTLSEAKLRRKVAFLVGNEGAGAQQSYIDMADVTVKIDMSNAIESLNVAVAHGIVAHELYIKRRT
jgi:tRNA G18 (ribose-2'-O)-methylase SpoU